VQKPNKKKPPPPPKGNQYALGNCGGAPAVYTDEWLREEAQRFREWMKQPDSLFLKSFAIERGYSPQRLSEFAEKSPEFAEALVFAKGWQEAKLVTLGLWGRLNSAMTKFVLLNCHSWKEEIKDQAEKTIVYHVNYGNSIEVSPKTLPAADSSSAQ
jgi:hypothetical protein